MNTYNTKKVNGMTAHTSKVQAFISDIYRNITVLAIILHISYTMS